MEKRSLILFLVFSLVAFLWFLIIGQGGNSAFFGRINLIDEGQFASWMTNIFQGKMMYRDIYIQYGPFMIYPVYFLMKFFGFSFFYVRLWFLISSFMGFMVGVLTLKKLNVNRYVFIISVITLLIVPGIQIRHWIGVLIILLLVEAYNKKSIFANAFSGVILGVAIFQSIEVGIFSLITAAIYFLARIVKQKNLYYELKMAGFFFIGLAVTLLLFSVIFDNQGWFASYLSTSKEFSNSIAGMNLPNGQGLPPLFQKTQESISVITIIKAIFSKNMLFYWSLILLLIFLPVFLIRLTFRTRNNSDALALLISIFTLLIYVSIIGRSGHYATIFPFILVLAAYCLSFVRKINFTKKSLQAKMYWLLFIIFCGYALRHIAIYRYNLVPDISRKDTVASNRTYPLTTTRNEATNIFLLKNFLDQHLSQGEPIYILNNVPGLYFLVNRKNVTRYDLPLLAGTIEKRMEIVNALKLNKPEFIIKDDSSWAVDGVSDEQRMPEVFGYVKFNYVPVKKIGPYVIYKIKEN